MNRILIVSVSICSLIALTPAISNALPFFDFYGYSYLDGVPNTVGTVVTVPTLLNEVQPDPIWPVDFDTNEYTVLVEGLTIQTVTAIHPFLTIVYSGGTIRLCEDDSKNATLQGWDPNPPNPSVPANFGDGDVLLSGVFTDMVLFFNTLTGSGTVSGSVTWIGGTKLPDIASPTGWTYFGGVSNSPDFGIPEGYDLVWDPQLYGPEPIPAIESSWGMLKRSFD